MPRFVVLEHDHPALHWDLMLEADGALQAWRLAQSPELSASAIEALALPDHRVIYLDYEGPVSGNRGNVKRWDTGDFDEEPDSAPELRKLFLKGERLRAQVRLIRISEMNWSFRVLPTDSGR